MTAHRIRKLQQNLSSLAVDALLVESTIDLYYLTGFDLSAGTFYLTHTRACLMVDGRYYESCKNVTGFEVLLKEDTTLQTELEKDKIASIGIDNTTLTVSRFEQLKQQFPQIKIESLDSFVMPLRMIKDAEELDTLRTAARLGSSGYDYARSLLRPGVTEKEIATNLEIFWLENGGEGLAFQPIIAFGSASALPHYHAGDNSLQKDDIALIDIGVIKNNYHSDMTRVHFFGHAPQELHKIYDIVRTAQEKALEICKAGTTVGELDDAARNHIQAEGYGDKFTHGLGHGIGLEIHEPPFLRKKGAYANCVLQPGMVITIEPGIYIPGLGGVRLENTIIITETGFEDLTQRDL